MPRKVVPHGVCILCAIKSECKHIYRYLSDCVIIFGFRCEMRSSGLGLTIDFARPRLLRILWIFFFAVPRGDMVQQTLIEVGPKSFYAVINTLEMLWLRRFVIAF